MGVYISVEKISISIFGGVKLKKVLILDHKKDTLIYVNRLKTSLVSVKRALGGDLIFQDIYLDEPLFHLKTYKSDQDSNLTKFIDKLASDTPSESPFLMIANNIFLRNGHFILADENKETITMIDWTKLSANVEKFKIYDSDIYGIIEQLGFRDSRGLLVKNLTGVYSYGENIMTLQDFKLSTNESMLKGDISLHYGVDSFSDFVNKVRFDAIIKSASISTNDIRFFYNEIGKNQTFQLKSKVEGTLNSLVLSQLNIKGKDKLAMQGKLHLKNMLGEENQIFSVEVKLANLSADYDDLIKLLPNILEPKLPIFLKKLETVSLTGTAKITPTTIDAVVFAETTLGKAMSNFSMKNFDNENKVSYLGNISLEDFDLGKLFDYNSVGKTTLNINVNGIGFSEKSLNTTLKGKIANVYYNKYTYQNISLNGIFKKPYYKGEIEINDPNLALNFDGEIDLTEKEKKYNFKIDVKQSDLNKLHFVNDSISHLKAQSIVHLQGHGLEDLKGSVQISKGIYKNSKDVYYLDNLEISSIFDANKVRTISFKSTDAVSGEIVGKYKIGQLGKMLTNSIGGLYSHYKPLPVEKGQFLNFDLKLYNKIVEIFFPDISIADKTILKGSLNIDNDDFKFNFDSSKLMFYGNTANNVSLILDTKNTVFNTSIKIDSLSTPYYKVRDFSIINSIKKDTSYFKTYFRGGSQGEDYYDLNIYHTINSDNNNVVGINKSEIKFKDQIWFLNENKTPDNKIVFDKAFKNISFDALSLTHENQQVLFDGNIKGNYYKQIVLSLKNIDLDKATPRLENLTMKGKLNGSFSLEQRGTAYKPTASITASDIVVNNNSLGDFVFDAKGDQNLRNFSVNSFLKNNDKEIFSLKGGFMVHNKKTLLDLTMNLEDFKLDFLGPLGGDVVSNLRGNISGSVSINGSLDIPEINGRFFLEKTGLTIPLLNTDYVFNNRSVIDMTGEKFIFRNNTFVDTKFKTQGVLSGNISHKKLTNWSIDLKLGSKKLLVLNTQDSDDALYYGVAFIDGTANINGPIDKLFIGVKAKSEKGTSIKVPINYAESTSKSEFIQFLTPNEKRNLSNGVVIKKDKNIDYNGLELEFNLDLNPNAEVEIILDKNSGHAMTGKGNGNLLFKINTLGRFNMYGNYELTSGIYNFNYRGIIHKKIKLREGGSISWSGDPLKAHLNLEAIYKTSANPAILTENASFNKKVETNVVIGIRGDLTNLDTQFDIEFPTVSNILKSEIEYKLADREARQTQALYLLSTGTFLSPQGAGVADISGSAIETASSYFDKFMSSDSEAKEDKINLGVNVVSPEKKPGKETDGRVEATFSSQINDRISINGRVGVPFGGVNSAVIGNFEIKYNLNEEGTSSFVAFNKENNVNYIGEGIGYTQGGGVAYSKEFDSYKELFYSIFKKKLPEKSQTVKAKEDEDNYEKHNQNTNNPTEEEAPRNNRDIIIPEEDYFW